MGAKNPPHTHFILGTLGWSRTCVLGPGTQAASQIQGKLFHGALVAIKTAQRAFFCRRELVLEALSP